MTKKIFKKKKKKTKNACISRCIHVYRYMYTCIITGELSDNHSEGDILTHAGRCMLPGAYPIFFACVSIHVHLIFFCHQVEVIYTKRVMAPVRHYKFTWQIKISVDRHELESMNCANN